MNKSILKAIDALCDEIATNINVAENSTRAGIITVLTMNGLFLPDDSSEDATIAGEIEDESALAVVKDNIPKPGTRFDYNGMSFIVLGKEQGGILAVQEKPLGEEMPFDEKDSNDWRSATLRKYLNEEHIKKFNKGDLLPFVSDLTADDGLKEYGTSEDYIFLLSCDLYRKYRPYMPRHNNWIWTITPWSCTPEQAHIMRTVHSNGKLYGDHSSEYNAVAPACLFKPSVFQSK